VPAWILHFASIELGVWPRRERLRSRRRKTFFMESLHENLKDYMGVKEGTKKK